MLGTIALTWLVWYQTWFGAPLDDAELVAAMAPSATARQTQHGIAEIERRLGTTDPGNERWARLLVEASRREEPAVRNSAAWAMQRDAARPAFGERLHEMVTSDPSVLVRRNAATALAKANDPAGRQVLRSMLEPFTVVAPAAGRAEALAAIDLPLRENTVGGRVVLDDGTVADLRVPVPGRVVRRVAADGALVAAGDPVLVLAPDSAHAFEAVKALGLVGTEEDLELLGLAAAPQSSLGAEVAAMATAAQAAIRARGR